MKKWKCEWGLWDRPGSVVYYVFAYSEHAAMQGLIRKAQENHMIWISKPVEVEE